MRKALQALLVAIVWLAGAGGARAQMRGDTVTRDGIKYVIIQADTYSSKGICNVVGPVNRDISYVTIPSSINGLYGTHYNVEAIEKEAFANCINLQSAEIYADDIRVGAFKGCTNLQSADIRMSYSRYGHSSYGSFIDSIAFSGCSKLDSVQIRVSAIDARDSHGFVIYSSMSIGSKAFSDCTSLSHFDIAHVKGCLSGVNFGDSVFSGSNMKTIRLPLGYIEERYSELAIRNPTPCVFSSQTFAGCPVEKLYIFDRLRDYSFLNGLQEGANVYVPKDDSLFVSDTWSGTPKYFGYDISDITPYQAAVKFKCTEIKPDGLEMHIRGDSPDENGYIWRDDLILGYRYFYEKVKYRVKTVEGEQLDLSTPIDTFETKHLNTSCHIKEVGQTYAEIDSIVVDTDESLAGRKKCIYFSNGGWIFFDDDHIRLDLCPGASYGFKLGVGNWSSSQPVYDSSLAYNTWPYYFNTRSLRPRIEEQSVWPTTLRCSVSDTVEDATIVRRYIAVGDSVYEGRGNFCIGGLMPGTPYSAKYSVETPSGTESASFFFDTPALELTTLKPKVVSQSAVIVGAKSNLDDSETGAGFQWRLYSWPDDIESDEAYAPVFDGAIEGYLRYMQPDLYKVRAFVQFSDGTRHYADWYNYDQKNMSYFEPTVHTYPMGEVTSNSVTVQGYVLPGTDEITEQGFEYWQEGGQHAPRRVPAESAPAADGVSVVLSSGQVMTARLTDLVPNTAYSYRAFVRTQAGTIYGEQRGFVSGEDPMGVGAVVARAADRTVVGVFGLDGRKLDSKRKGFNIVRYSDGTSQKVFVK